MHTLFLCAQPFLCAKAGRFYKKYRAHVISKTNTNAALWKEKETTKGASFGTEKDVNIYRSVLMRNRLDCNLQPGMFCSRVCRIEVKIPRNPKPKMDSNAQECLPVVFKNESDCKPNWEGWIRVKQLAQDTSQQVIVYNDGPVHFGSHLFRVEGPTIRVEFGAEVMIP